MLALLIINTKHDRTFRVDDGLALCLLLLHLLLHERRCVLLLIEGRHALPPAAATLLMCAVCLSQQHLC